jgi:hypothetical protein
MWAIELKSPGYHPVKGNRDFGHFDVCTFEKL